ncbi:MAG: hypothetical protein ACLFPS_01975 [Clostridia bacterium]
MKKVKRKIFKVVARFNNQGSAFVDIAVKVGVGIIAGSLIITFLEGNLTGLFEGLFTRIGEVLEITINAS